MSTALGIRVGKAVGRIVSWLGSGQEPVFALFAREFDPQERKVQPVR